MFLPQHTGGETYASEAKVSFLSALVSSRSAAQTAAKDLWPARVSPKTEAQVQSAMANQAPGLFLWCLCAPKGNLRNSRRRQAPLPPAASRLRAAQRSFRPQTTPATETDACKSHKFRSARNCWVRKDFRPSIPVSPTSLDIVVTLSSQKGCGKVSLKVPQDSMVFPRPSA